MIYCIHVIELGIEYGLCIKLISCKALENVYNALLYRHCEISELYTDHYFLVYYYYFISYVPIISLVNYMIRIFSQFVFRMSYFLKIQIKRIKKPTMKWDSKTSSI